MNQLEILKQRVDLLQRVNSFVESLISDGIASNKEVAKEMIHDTITRDASDTVLPGQISLFDAVC